MSSVCVPLPSRLFNLAKSANRDPHERLHRQEGGENEARHGTALPTAQLRVRAAADALIGQMVARKVAAMKRPTRRPAVRRGAHKRQSGRCGNAPGAK